MIGQSLVFVELLFPELAGAPRGKSLQTTEATKTAQFV
jgi:hypothetical protein